MKSTTYIVEITNQKNGKYLSLGRNPVACSPPRLVSTKKFSTWVYWKVFCRFWPIKLCDLFHVVSAAPIFCGNFLLSFLLWYHFKILVKSRGGDTFLSLPSSVNVWQKQFFFSWKLNIPSFIFLIWTEQFWIWFSPKLTKTVEISINFKSFCYFTPCISVESLYIFVYLSNIVRLGSADTKIGSQNAVKEVLELTKKWKYQNFRGKF